MCNMRYLIYRKSVYITSKITEEKVAGEQKIICIRKFSAGGMNERTKDKINQFNMDFDSCCRNGNTCNVYGKSDGVVCKRA